MIRPFCCHHSIVLILASDRAVLNGNDVFSILVASTKKRYSSFLKKVFAFQKICSKVFKTFETSTDCHIKTCRSLKQSAILKIPSTIFRRTYSLSVGFKMKTVRRSVSNVKTKTNSSFAVNVAERSSHSFLLSI